MIEHTSAGSTFEEIAKRVSTTPLIDSHEHLVEESSRVHFKPGGRQPCDDWATLFSHYLDSDLCVAGMPWEEHQRFLSDSVDPALKWKILEPWWPAVKNTGYGRAVRIAIERLYGIGELNARSAEKLQDAYRKRIRKGYYREVLCDVAGIESCQVNSLERTFMETDQPQLLMQDLSILDMHMNPTAEHLAKQAGIAVRDLSDYHRVVDWWFARYAPYAVAVKSQAAYSRKLDYADIPPETAAPILRRLVNGDEVQGPDRKKVEDHLFWYCVRKATEHDLPVKLHTGYHAGYGGMNLDWVQQNPRHACELLRRAPQTTFVFMHIGYPYQGSFIALAKHFHNAVIDMCWAWIIDPLGAQRFLEQLLVTAPASKVLTFGGDYIPVEPVVGHAAIARNGISRALTNLVEEGWLNKADALELVDPIMHGNARRIFRLEEKSRALAHAPWAS